MRRGVTARCPAARVCAIRVSDACIAVGRGEVWALLGGGRVPTRTNSLEDGRALWVLVQAARAGEAHIDGLRHPRRLARVPSKDGRVKGKRQPVVRHSRTPRKFTAPAGMDPSKGAHGTGGLGPCELGVQAAHDLPPALGRVQLVLLPGTRGGPPPVEALTMRREA